MALLALLISVVLSLGPFYPPLSLRSMLVIITFQLILSCHHQLTGTQVPLCPSAFSGLFPSSQAPSMFRGHILGLIAHAIFNPWRRWQEVLTQITPFAFPSILSNDPLLFRLPRIATVIPTSLAGTQSPRVLGVISHTGTHALPVPFQAAPRSHSRGTRGVCRGLGSQ